MIQVVIILVMLMGAGGFGAYTWVQRLQAENQILQVNQDKLQGALDDQALVVQMQEQDAKAIQKINASLRAEVDAAEKDAKNLAKKLGRHELDILAANKPGLVVKIINRASKNEMRCYEIASGSPEAINSEEELIHFFNQSAFLLLVTPSKSGPIKRPPPIV